MSKSLKPCPFCGSERVNGFLSYRRAGAKGYYTATVMCYDCNCTVPNFNSDPCDCDINIMSEFAFDVCANAIAAWNMRADDA